MAFEQGQRGDGMAWAEAQQCWRLGKRCSHACCMGRVHGERGSQPAVARAMRPMLLHRRCCCCPACREGARAGGACGHVPAVTPSLTHQQFARPSCIAEWERELVQYAAAHPETRVFDLPPATYPLRNRGSMVSFLDGEGWVFEVRRGLGGRGLAGWGADRPGGLYCNAGAAGSGGMNARLPCLCAHPPAARSAPAACCPAAPVQEPAAQVEPGRAPQRCRCNVPTNTTLAEGTSLEAAVAQMEAAGKQLLRALGPWRAAAWLYGMARLLSAHACKQLGWVHTVCCHIGAARPIPAPLSPPLLRRPHVPAASQAALGRRAGRLARAGGCGAGTYFCACHAAAQQ